MVIFSHRGIGFGQEENSLEALRNAVRGGFSVEVDLRFIKNNIILSHDEVTDDKSVPEFNDLLKLIEGNPQVYFALHLKEDSPVFFDALSDAIKGFNNCFLFMTDFVQGNFIATIFEKLRSSQLAMYANDTALDTALLGKADYLWLDETKSHIYDKLNYFQGFNKKIVCCSPELFMNDYNARLKGFQDMVRAHREDIFGICTDFCDTFTPLDNIHCPVCGFRGPFNDSGSVNAYALLGCGSCGLEFSYPMRSNYGYYENLHYDIDDPNLHTVLSLSKQEFLDKAAQLSNNINRQPHNLILKWIDKNLKKGSTILDIGCGVGWFIAALQAEGFNSVGIEVSTSVVNMLRDKGLQVHMGPLEAINFSLPMPDLVVLLGVIEHVEDPVGLLKEIKGKFPKAVLLLTIPNPRRWSTHYSEFPPNHLTPVWTEDSLKVALEKSRYSLKELFFPDISSDEVWFFLLDIFFLKIGLRKKGYFVGLTSDINKDIGFIKTMLKALYPALEKANIMAKYMSRPILNKISIKMKKDGRSASSAFAVAYPILK